MKGFPFKEPTGGFFGGAGVVAEHSDNKQYKLNISFMLYA